MPARKDTATVAVEFFQTASLESAKTVLAIAKSIVAKRKTERPAPPAPREPS